MTHTLETLLQLADIYVSKVHPLDLREARSALQSALKKVIVERDRCKEMLRTNNDDKLEIRMSMGNLHINRHLTRRLLLDSSNAQQIVETVAGRMYNQLDAEPIEDLK